MLLARTEQTVRKSGMVAIFVLHPKKGGRRRPTRPRQSPRRRGVAEGIAGFGGVAESHEGKKLPIRTSCGTDEQKHNRTVYVLKARSGEGENTRLAYKFQTGKDQGDTGALTLRELGLIVRRKKGAR